MSTKAEITAAARKRFKTEDVDLGAGVKLTLRELSRSERKALDERLWKKNADGTPLKDDEGFNTLVDGVHYVEEWISAAVTPALTVEDLLLDDWPASLKDEGKSPETLRPEYPRSRKKLREQHELWFAQTLALHFRIPDFWTILDEWPESMVTYWQARYLLEPWDAENRKALTECKYKAPDFEPVKHGGRRRLSGGAY